MKRENSVLVTNMRSGSFKNSVSNVQIYFTHFIA
jgi:hypothetical protein